MANCPNCKKKLSCGCQKRTASDGKTVCSGCVKTYEAGIKQKKTVATVSRFPMCLILTFFSPKTLFYLT
jgi:hypothetical protein